MSELTQQVRNKDSGLYLAILWIFSLKCHSLWPFIPLWDVMTQDYIGMNLPFC